VQATVTIDLTPHELGRALMRYALLRMTGNPENADKDIWISGGKVYMGDSFVSSDPTDATLIRAAKTLMAESKKR
ncbi:MAG: hypothetical protein IT330_00695, partial [Anaerolineae bacterium]|nr:hypothetical protein [Anaerolineae bacterium]